VSLQPVRVALSEDHEGRLAFVNGSLVAVLVRLSELHGEQAGSWFLEAGFGDLDDPHRPLFPDLESAQSWIAERLSGPRRPRD
jgi:hypothetical protein